MPARPRVLVVTPDFPPDRGGIQTLVHRIVLHAERLHARVVALPAPGAERFDSTQPIDIRRSPISIRDRRAAVLGLNGFALREALRFRPQVVLSAHIVTSPAARLAASFTGSSTVQYLHADELRGRPRLTRFAVRHADAIVAVSRYTETLARRAGAGPESVHVIHNGVDPVSHAVDGSRAGSPTLLTVARLDNRYKGFDVTMRALPLIRGRVPGACWVVVGDGVLRAQLEAQALSLGVEEHVCFHGFVGDGQRNECLARAHVFVMPARLPAHGVGGEGFGIAYLEAGAHGLPVVAGNVGGAVDAVIDGETGVLVDPRDHIALADAVSDLLLDPAKAEDLGRAGAERARHLGWPQVVRRIEDLVLQMVDRRR